jgi:L-ascorbate metabolism protein UlaG (beta-lactamase superfamily)
VTPLGNRRLLQSAHLRRIEELDWWQSSDSAPISITLTPAHHFSARGILDRNRALWGGFVIAAATRRIYFAGDTAYGAFFPDISRRLGPIDVALLPIGAYEPRWFMQSVHMNPAEAVRAHRDLGVPHSIGMHFGTFQLTSEGIDDPVSDLAAARDASQIAPAAFTTLAHGESFTLA